MLAFTSNDIMKLTLRSTISTLANFWVSLVMLKISDAELGYTFTLTSLNYLFLKGNRSLTAASVALKSKKNGINGDALVGNGGTAVASEKSAATTKPNSYTTR